MKRKLVASMLGVAGLAATSLSSYGQGSVIFENYDFGSGLNAPVTFAAAGQDGATSVTAGETVGSDFVATLIYSLNGGTTWLSDGTSSGTYPTPFGFGTVAPGDSADYAGYFVGGSVSLTSLTTQTSALIEIEVYNGASYGATGAWSGISAPTTVSTALGDLGIGSTPAGNDLGASSLAPFTVSFISAAPEPGTLALAGLGGLASLVAMRRRKA